MDLWYAQVYMILSAWCFHELGADQCTADACVRCASNPLPDFDLECTLGKVSSNQPGVLVYRLFCYVTENTCALVNLSDVEDCALTPNQIGCYCSLHVTSLEVAQEENGSLTFVSGSASYHVQTYKASRCIDGYITELCEAEEYTTEPLQDFLKDAGFSCRCYGANCSSSITVTIRLSVEQPTQTPNSTGTFSQLWTVTDHSSSTSRMASVSLPGNAPCSGGLIICGGIIYPVAALAIIISSGGIIYHNLIIGFLT